MQLADDLHVGQSMFGRTAMNVVRPRTPGLLLVKDDRPVLPSSWNGIGTCSGSDLPPLDETR